MHKIICDTVNSLIFLADEYGKNRNWTIQQFVHLFTVMSEITDFSAYETDIIEED